MLWKKISTPESAPNRLGPVMLESDDAGPLLRECCSRTLPATVVIPDIGLSSNVHYRSCTADTVSFTLTEEGHPHFRPHTVCFVNCFLDGRGMVFSAAVQERKVRREGDEGMLYLERPEFVIGMEIRRWFRVPLDPATALRISATVEGTKTVHPTPLNISMGGLRMGFEAKEDPELSVGDVMPLTLDFGETSLTFAGEVRRTADREYGVVIPSETSDSMEYRTLVSAVEREWLQRRQAMRGRDQR